MPMRSATRDYSTELFVNAALVSYRIEHLGRWVYETKRRSLAATVIPLIKSVIIQIQVHSPYKIKDK